MRLAHLTFATAALLGLATPVAAATAPADACAAECNAAALSADDRATCHLQCARAAEVQATPSIQRVPAQPTASRPPTSTPPAATPTQPQPTVTSAVASPGHQRALCESQCDAEPVASDRATCRLHCAQLTHVAASPTPTTGATGPVTHYSFPPGGGPPTAVADSTPPAQQQQIAVCQSTCDREPSATDRATCRNNCAAVGTVVGPASPGRWVLGPAPTDTTDPRAAVIRTSPGVASPPARPVAVPTSQSASPSQPQTIAATPADAQCAAQAQVCATPCASEQQSCAAQCDSGKLSSTDRATCQLTCDSAADMCRDDCRLKEATCRAPARR